MAVCAKCNNTFDNNELILTDEFKDEAGVKSYCSSCFIEGVKTGFGHYDIGSCGVCNNPLVLQFDDKETVELAKVDGTVHYICKKVHDALQRGNENELNKLEEEEHEFLIVYAVEPEDDEEDEEY
ncbi:hypothetical protein [Peribacillus alkalitolerans]|uniref:hypothetical protein n=1 Tax=Peribacillus alkalitolerans TaxID=1550385 RepID=UPI0013D1B29A|nr:hypothetical protein [Peribacillus alkalitolerans]